jgi:hypothetical protein
MLSAENSVKSSANLYIGVLGGRVYLCSGNIDELAIINRVLSPSEIALIYGAGHPTSLSMFSPASWLRFEMSFADSGSTGITCTGVGSPSFSSSVP